MATNNTNCEPQLHISFSNTSKIELFEAFFLKDFIKDTLLFNISNNINKMKVIYGKFLQWIGLFPLMSTAIRLSRCAFFSPKYPMNSVNHLLGCITLCHIHGLQLYLIASTISQKAPVYKDRFWEIQEMIEVWNIYTIKTFSPRAVNCLDESMSTWRNNYTCLGFIFIPRKPSKFDIIGGNATRHLLQLCKSLFYSGKLLILDDGFNALHTIFELKKYGVFAAALIKKEILA